MYSADSFFTLTPLGQFGLGLVSAFFLTVLIWGMMRIQAHWILRIGVALLTLWLFAWLSPQIYYLYFRLIIDGLPLQWVIKTPPSLGHIVDLFSFRADATLSAHSQGAFGWLLIAAAAMRKKP